VTDLEAARRLVSDACCVLAARGLADAHLGHVSLRVDGERLLIRCRGPDGVSIRAVSVTWPSAGDRIKPSPAGIARSGSRKNHRKKAARIRGRIPHTQLPVAQSTAAATRIRLMPYM